MAPLWSGSIADCCFFNPGSIPTSACLEVIKVRLPDHGFIWKYGFRLLVGQPSHKTIHDQHMIPHTKNVSQVTLVTFVPKLTREPRYNIVGQLFSQNKLAREAYSKSSKEAIILGIILPNLTFNLPSKKLRGVFTYKFEYILTVWKKSWKFLNESVFFISVKVIVQHSWFCNFQSTCQAIPSVTIRL